METANIHYERLDGTMKRDERTRSMDALKNDPSCEVLLVSLKAGGVGLNLTAAQRVYLMDPYWYVRLLFPKASVFGLIVILFPRFARNPAVENQAVDRIVRSLSLTRARLPTDCDVIFSPCSIVWVKRNRSRLSSMSSRTP